METNLKLSYRLGIFAIISMHTSGNIIMEQDGASSEFSVAIGLVIKDTARYLLVRDNTVGISLGNEKEYIAGCILKILKKDIKYLDAIKSNDNSKNIMIRSSS